MTGLRPKRHLRSTKACDYCHQRRIKCRVSEDDPTRCQNCVDFELTCGSLRPVRRGKSSPTHRIGLTRRSRTPPASDASLGRSHGTDPAAARPLQPLVEQPQAQRDILTRQTAGGDREQTEPLSLAWTAFAQASQRLIEDLLGIYFETVFPIFPFFDRENLRERLARQEHTHNRGFFCSVMAACALASARIRDGALVSLSSYSTDLQSLSPETFFAAARDTLSTDVLHVRDFDSLRACALLSLASVQNLEIDAMRMYIGHYFTMVATWGWHNESNWPEGLSVVELEERRRLYWSVYTWDVFTSIVWDSCIHFQEGHASVQYPSSDPLKSHRPTQDSWIVGWNFTTDLYRRLEHVLDRLRTRSSSFNIFADKAKGLSAAETGQIHIQVNSLYSALPRRFRKLAPATGGMEEDIYGFQAANIQATLALLRIALLSLEYDVDLDKKCSVVSEVLDIFHQVPKAYQRAISTPLIYHMGGIGNILGSVMEAPLSDSAYQRVKGLLLSMADLLESLESFHKQRAGAGRKLQDQVKKIDAFMSSRREAAATEAHNTPTNLPDPAPAQFVPLPELDNGLAGGAEELNGISPTFQIPGELLEDWDWTFNIYQSQFPYFGDSY